MPLQFDADGTVVAPSTPSDIPNIWFWGEASREVGLVDNDRMPTLTDQSGNGRDWSQATNTRRPTYKTNQLNSLAVAQVVRDGDGSKWWDGPDMSSLTAAHVFIVVKIDTDPPAASNKAGLWSLGSSLSSTFYPFTDAVIYDDAFSTVRKTVGDPASALTSWRVYEVSSIVNEWIAKLDGVEIFSTGSNTFGVDVAPMLGSNAANDAMEGQIAGAYIFSAKLTTDRADMVTYLNDRFALSIV